MRFFLLLMLSTFAANVWGDNTECNSQVMVPLIQEQMRTVIKSELQSLNIPVNHNTFRFEAVTKGAPNWEIDVNTSIESTRGSYLYLSELEGTEARKILFKISFEAPRIVLERDTEGFVVRRYCQTLSRELSGSDKIGLLILNKHYRNHLLKEYSKQNEYFEIRLELPLE